VAQNEWWSVGQDSLELSTLDLGIELVDTSGVDLNKYVVLAQLRLWHFANPYAVRCSIAIDDERPHDDHSSRD
jgi:hypothetical protein